MSLVQQNNFPSNVPAVGRGGELQTTEAVRAAAETQGMIVSAKNFPRDQNAAYTRIMQACERLSLAEVAVYAYPRGSETVSGPSIRLAEVIAQNWGNIYTGVKEVSQGDGESQMIAFAWDTETNFKDVREFVVKHQRTTKRGVSKLSDERDIYELTANMASRRKRACILAVVPRDIIEAAVVACNATLEKGEGNVPMPDRIRTCVLAFSKLGVTQEMIEKRLGHKVDTCIPAELIKLKQIWTTINDGNASREDFFEFAAVDVKPSEKAEALTERLKAAAQAKPDAAKKS